MELKLTADKKLLEVLERLAEALSAHSIPAAAPVAATTEASEWFTTNPPRR